MIKASELRIGNIVSVKERGRGCGIAGKVSAIPGTILVEMFNSNEEFYPEEKLFGMPLDEVWLKTFGFLEPSQGYEREFIHDDTFFVRENKSDNSIYYWEEVKLQYVHQLQNLHFALTGKEL